MNQRPSLTAIILAGGQSRRMGADKALLRLPSGGPTLIERVVAAAQLVADDVVIVAEDAGRLPPMDVRTVPDAIAGAGPLAGLVAGFAAARHSDILALACDLPYLSVPLLHWMAGLPRTWDALVPSLPNAEGKTGWEPLHALYTRACLAPMRAALDRGDRHATAFFSAINVQPLTANEMRPHDSAGRSTISVNTPDAWAEAARWLVNQADAILRNECIGDALTGLDNGEMTMALQGGRDYRKFMVDDALEPALMPLDVWNALFDEYQNKPGNFYKGFKRLGVLRLDVEQEIKQAEEAGKWLTEDEAARNVLYEVIDELGNDMWYQRAMSLIEEDCRKDVAWRSKNYAKYLDPVYDEQETRGWLPYWQPARWVLPSNAQ